MVMLTRIVHRLFRRWRAARVRDEENGVAMYCCQGLKNLIGAVGQRGLSVVVHEKPFGFSLQSRAVSPEDLSRLSQEPTPLPIPGHVTLVASMRLSYCPFCGTKLRRLVPASNLRRFQALVERHKELVI
jgi:hypothetical protein